MNKLEDMKEFIKKISEKDPKELKKEEVLKKDYINFVKKCILIKQTLPSSDINKINLLKQNGMSNNEIYNLYLNGDNNNISLNGTSKLVIIKNYLGIPLDENDKKIINENQNNYINKSIKNFEKELINSNGNYTFEGWYFPSTIQVIKENEELFKNYLRQLYKEQGLDIDNIVIKFEQKSISKKVSINYSIRKMSINNSSENIKEYRKKFVIDNFITPYQKQENDIMKYDYDINYEINKNFICESVKNKKVNMNANVLSEIYMNGKINNGNGFEWTLSAIIRMSQLLKCANELSIINNFDYLGEFVSIQPIHTIIGEMINSKESIKEFKELKNLSFNKNIKK